MTSSGYLVSLYFDATCDKGATTYDHEIIRISAELISTTNGEIIERWSSLASAKGKVTKYCTEKTGITQKQVNSARSLSEVMRQFDAWLKANVNGSFHIVTDGHFDMQTLYWKQAVGTHKEINASDYKYMTKWVNLKKTFQEKYGGGKKRISQMADKLKVDPQLPCVVSELVKRGAAFTQFDTAPSSLSGGGSIEMPKGGEVKPQPFDYYLVIDFECTCTKGRAVYNHEIIEFPIVVVCSKTNNIVDSFTSYVRPVSNPQLTDFCTELTGITQANVDGAPVLSEVLDEIDSWLRDKKYLSKESSVCFVADCASDLQDFFWTQSVIKQRAVPVDKYPYYHQWCDLGMLFKEVFKSERTQSLKQMLQLLDMKFEGRQHSGIDDARNIARILMKIIEVGEVAEANDCFKQEYLGVLAFQTTCCKTGESRKSSFTKEIIEIGMTVVDASSAKLIDVFQTYVCPKQNKKLTGYCKEALNITQQTISESPGLQTAFENMTSWLTSKGYYSQGKHPFTIVALGSDIKELFWSTSLKNNSLTDTSQFPFMNKWINLQKAFFLTKKSDKLSSSPSINKMLSSLKLDPISKGNSAKDLSLNAARIINFMIRYKGIHTDAFEET